MHWITAVERLRRERQPGVLVTVVSVRGHAAIEDPRCRTAVACKLVVAPPAVGCTSTPRVPGAGHSASSVHVRSSRWMVDLFSRSTPLSTS